MGSGLAEAAAAASAVVAASVAADAAVVAAVLPRQVVATEYACKSPGCSKDQNFCASLQQN